MDPLFGTFSFGNLLNAFVTLLIYVKMEGILKGLMEGWRRGRDTTICSDTGNYSCDINLL